MGFKLAILTLVAVVTFVAVPATSNGVSAQQNERRNTRTWQQNGDRDRDHRRSPWSSRTRHRGTWRDTHGYRNYGQYRRTQVGNRRWRTYNRYTMTTRRYRRTRTYRRDQ